MLFKCSECTGVKYEKKILRIFQSAAQWEDTGSTTMTKLGKFDLFSFKPIAQQPFELDEEMRHHGTQIGRTHKMRAPGAT